MAKRIYLMTFYPTDCKDDCAEIIRNNLEHMVETRNKGHLVVCKEDNEDGI